MMGGKKENGSVENGLSSTLTSVPVCVAFCTIRDRVFVKGFVKGVLVFQCIWMRRNDRVGCSALCIDAD